MQIRDFKVWVADDEDDHFAEHCVAPVNENTIECFLEADIGNEFSIWWKDLREARDTGMCVSIFVDGEEIDYRFLFPDDNTPNSCDGMPATSSTRKPFTFSAPNLVEGNTPGLFKDREKLRQIGTIKIRCYRAHYRATSPDEIEREDELTHRNLSEKDKKGLSARTTFGEEIECEEDTQFRVQHVDPYGGEPYATFVFRYMSLAMLQARGIVEIPRDESSESEERRQAEKAKLIAANLQLKQQIREKRKKVARPQDAILLDDSDDEEDDDGTPAYKVAKTAKGKTVIVLD